ncbi:UbiA family prenyltransferase [Aspergillus alliaceus]|uniref:UbiA family prenyltransferase n=1 Tax=Petromyces alliaceus TaxID=209559 RepID=UPI0012A57D1E|nr:UbiA prenyltransferase family-domain-containing protein [Aspergillus alliaceus]KAB8233035.1 UbiA prenyltransferase family-domain-containing protein [Aspergillus alliaceus]
MSATTTTQCLTLSTPTIQPLQKDHAIPKSANEFLRQVLHHEFLITARLLRANIREGLVLPIIGLIARFLPAPDLLLTTPWTHLAMVLVKTFFCFVCHLYVFEIVNQALSVEEDIANKPHRPIPAGLLSIPGAYRRWLLSWAICPAVASHIAGPEAARLFGAYQAWVYFCYVWPKINHWILRNAFASIGTYNMFRLVDTIIHSEIPSFPVMSTKDLLVLSLWVMATVHMQEFHDAEGDRRMKRKTLPVVVGPQRERVLRAGTALLVTGPGIVLLITTASYYAQRISFALGHWTLAGLVVTCILHNIFACVVGFRCIRHGDVAFDRKTYKRFYMLAAYTMVCYLSFWQVAQKEISKEWILMKQ